MHKDFTEIGRTAVFILVEIAANRVPFGKLRDRKLINEYHYVFHCYVF